MTTRRVHALLASAVLLAGACGGDDEDATRTSTGGASKVSIDADNGDLQVETEDGSFTIRTRELPDDWPTDVPLPRGHELSSAMRSGDGPDRSFSISGTFPGPAQTIFDEVVAAFSAQEWTEIQQGSTDIGASATFDNGTWTAVFSTTATGSGSTFAYTVVASRT